MQKITKLHLLILFIVYASIAKSQVNSQGFGAHPNGQNWHILKSPAIRVIYPEGMESRSQRIANIINHISDSFTRSVGSKRYAFDLVLQNRTTIPNGFVALAPARSEFFCTPPSNNNMVGSLDWLDILTIHEYRHILQTANTRHGLTKVGSYLAGQRVWSIINAINIPNWYLEGDAVITETALTNSGRGRAPFFTKEFRTFANENKFYHYYKLRNGSFKTLLPDHYLLGYLMLTQVRNEKGNDVTATVLKQASALKGIFYPFSRAMKRNTGYTTKQLYNKSITEFYKTADKNVTNSNIKPATPVTTIPKKTVTFYHSPRYLTDGSIVAIKSSFKKIESLCRITQNGKEKKLTGIGKSFDSYITVGNDIVAWTENTQDPRRANLNYTEIVLFNTKTNTKKRLTEKSRYFSPVVSKDGLKVAAVHATNEQLYTIVILDINTGKVMQTLPNKQNAFLSRMAWLNDNELVALSKLNSRLAIVKYTLSSGDLIELTPRTYHNMEGISTHGNDIYFQSDFSGIDNIYSIAADRNKEIYQITNVAVGAYLPDVSADGKEIIFSEISSMGLNISKTAAGNNTIYPVTITEPADMPMFETVANSSEGGDILHKIPNQIYPSKKYNNLFRGLKLHSWSISPSNATPKLQVQMNNILNDVGIKFGGGINRNENNSSFYDAELVIGRYFPEIKLLSSQSERVYDILKDNDTIKVRSNEFAYGINLGIPLLWVKDNFNTHLQANVGFSQRAISESVAGKDNLKDQNFGSYDIGFSFGTIKRTALQNVGPNLGFTLDGNYTKAVNMQVEKLNAITKTFLPGISANHHVVLKAGYQKELLTNQAYQYVDNFDYPRGFFGIINDEVSMYSVTYGLPLAYPDFGLFGITYFKRVRANLFYDAATTKINNTSQQYASAGIELIFDNVHFNALPISFGVRSAYLLQGPNLDNRSHFNFYLATPL